LDCAALLRHNFTAIGIHVSSAVNDGIDLVDVFRQHPVSQRDV
jgi:hypothetical protein